MKTRLKLIVTALTAVGLTAGAVFYFSSQPPAPLPAVSPELAAAEKAKQAELARLKAEGIRPPAVKNGKTLSLAEKEATAKAKPTLHTSLLNLDLTRVPTEQELIEAGQLGDPLSPTGPADPAKITDPAKKALQERDNLAFGKAIQTWNEHHYDSAVKMFAQHIEEFPESPWAGESRLHIGCAAQYRGEYDVCYEQFGKILDTSKVGTDLNQKAQLRVANILTKQGRFEEAAQAYLEAMKTEKNPKRMSYASSWLPLLSMFKQQKTALRDCVQKSLQEICLMQGRSDAAAQVATIPAMHENGFTSAQIMQLARDLGMQPQVLHVKGKVAEVLPTPFLAHYKDEHFVAVLHVGGGRIRVFDSRVGFTHDIPSASFLAQWSGYAITLEAAASPHPDLAIVTGEELNHIIGGCCGITLTGAPTGPEDEKTPCATGSREPAGEDAKGAKTDPIANSDCSPNWDINPNSLNMIVRDVPMWWDSPYGLDVTFSFTFNSQDNLSAIRPAGEKWFLNYGAYAMEDPSGKVTIVAGNSRQWAFLPASGGMYTPPTDFPCTLVKTGAYEYQLTHQTTGTVYLYGRPAGVNTSASLFLSATDQWGVSVSMTHNANAAITQVTHSLGGTWNLIYNAAGRLERIDDPFGRSAYLAYDTPGMLREMTDMGGLKYAFKYSTSANPVNATPSSQIFMSEIVYAPQELTSASASNRTWHAQSYQFLTEPPDNNSSGMWARYRVTTSNTAGTQEVHYYDGNGVGYHRTATQVAAGNAGTSFTYTVANGQGKRSGFSFSGGGTATLGAFNSAAEPLTITRRDGVVITRTLNAFEKPLTMTDPANRTTTFEYEANGMDLKKITGPDNAVAVQVLYNAKRQPTEVTRRDGTKTVMTYHATTGQPLTTTVKDAAGVTVQTSTVTYNAGNRVASVDVDGRTVASYTYDAVGRVLTLTNEDNQITTLTYDALNRVTKTTYHDGTSAERAFHGIKGMVAWERDRDGQNTLFFYDRAGYRIAANAPGNRFYYWGYNKDGQMTLLIDPKGNRTTWEYDIEGRVIKKTLQDGAVEQLAWNTKSQLTQHTSPRGLKSIFAYDTLGRMLNTSYQTAAGATAFPTESVTYDILDRIATSTDAEGTTTYTFDAVKGWLNSVDGPYAADTVSYAHDDLGRVDEVTTPGGITQSFHFDSDERLDTWTDVFGSGSITYAGRTGRVTNVSRASGLLTTNFAYTAANDLFKLAQIKHETTTGGTSSTISQFDYTWNAQQDMASWIRTLGSTPERETKHDLGHDAAHQLVSATLKQVSNSAVQADQRWGFDSIGNRTLEHDLVTGHRTEYTHNATNQLVDKKTYTNGQKPWVKGSLNEPGSVSVGGKPLPVKADGTFEGQAPSATTTITAKDSSGNAVTESWQLTTGNSTPNATLSYTHDTEGNMLSDGTSTFEWDLRNRLTAIVTGTHRTEFTYDGSDRRVRVVEKDSGTVTSDLRYIFNGLTLLEERAANNTAVLRRFYGSGHVDVADSGKRYAYTTDHLGSIREVMLLDGTSGAPITATLTARYDYDLWGKRTVLDGGTAVENLVMHGYTGHVRHAWSGLWLAPYRAYSPTLGRWISRDPIGESGGVNLYAYVGNAAAVAVDPLGWINISFVDFDDPGNGYANGTNFRRAASMQDALILPMNSLQQVHDTLQAIHESGVPIDRVDFWDHGASMTQATGDGEKDEQYTPEFILTDPSRGIDKFLKPDGLVSFHGCQILNEAGADDEMQNLSDRTGKHLEAGSGNCAYGLGGYMPCQSGRKHFSPKTNSDKAGCDGKESKPTPPRKLKKLSNKN